MALYEVIIVASTGLACGVIGFGLGIAVGKSDATEQAARNGFITFRRKLYKVALADPVENGKHDDTFDQPSVLSNDDMMYGRQR